MCLKEEGIKNNNTKIKTSKEHLSLTISHNKGGYAKIWLLTKNKLIEVGKEKAMIQEV